MAGRKRMVEGQTTCQICFETAEHPQLSGCGHQSACAACLGRWIAEEESAGMLVPRCPMPQCQAPLQAEEVTRMLGRTYQPQVKLEADGGKDTKELDAETKAWLRENTKSCGGCGAHICKSDGCDKMQCLCGWRFCWRCGCVGATCDCNKGHGFFDNILRKPTFTTTPDVAQEISNLREFILQKRAAFPDRLEERERIAQLHREREAASLKIKAAIIQGIIRDDIDAAVGRYCDEVDLCGGPPVWVGELTPYVRFLGREVVEAMFPGVPCPS